MPERSLADKAHKAIPAAEMPAPGAQTLGQYLGGDDRATLRVLSPSVPLTRWWKAW